MEQSSRGAVSRDAGRPVADPEARRHAAYIRALRANSGAPGTPKGRPWNEAVATLERSIADLRRERQELLSVREIASGLPLLPEPAAGEWRALLQEFPAASSKLQTLAETEPALAADLEAALSARATPLYPLPLERYLPWDEGWTQVEYWSEIFAVFDAKHAELLADPQLTPAERQERLADWLHRQRRFVDSVLGSGAEDGAEDEE